ncbi:calcium-binding protein [Tolypothrix sp. PCC 7910]|uniref:EF-hand domain-containing protein n=1 Tax=Tolypothrix sp. PCC 7910 TaxID=2099387 RepID=UPI00142787CC|nr:EF-hand domain-containing protein [Tolypothrix sp. PCC 7910]QIR36321.1 calcium-binding protein [Tolypothrix sp. PCC 7910]
MLTEFQKQKARKSFEVHDFNGDGILTLADFELIVENLAKLGQKQRLLEYQALKSAYTSFWLELQALADIDNDGQVSLDEWYAYYDHHLVHLMMDFMFDLIDGDGDGEITVKEYKQFATCWNRSETEAGETFLKLDLNGDGCLTKLEILQHFDDFCYGNDPEVPGNWLWGPLS